VLPLLVLPCRAVPHPPSFVQNIEWFVASEVNVMGYEEWISFYSHVGYPGNARPPQRYAPLVKFHRPDPTSIARVVAGANEDPALPLSMLLRSYDYLATPTTAWTANNNHDGHVDDPH
jgi:hypothetical protein